MPIPDRPGISRFALHYWRARDELTPRTATLHSRLVVWAKKDPPLIIFSGAGSFLAYISRVVGSKLTRKNFEYWCVQCGGSPHSRGSIGGRHAYRTDDLARWALDNEWRIPATFKKKIKRRRVRNRERGV